jgi:uncharacterized protein (DUF305 family)
MSTLSRSRDALAVLGCLLAGCTATRSGQEAAPTAAPVMTTAAAVGRFMQGMIGHHAQALDMAALAPSRSSHPSVRLLAERIDVSQKDEIALMRRWLQRRGQALPDDDAHVHAAMGHGDLMPGMLTQQQLEELAAARGASFDRLFLAQMIRHHQGALQMVSQLLETHRNLDAETFRFVSEIDVDQRAEIQRMQSLLATIP